MGAHRFIHRGQKVHLSVAIKNGYHPKARFAVRDSLHSWDKIIGLNPDHTRTDWMAELHDVVELDLYDVSITNRRVEQLKGDIQNVEARKTVRDALDDLSILALQCALYISESIRDRHRLTFLQLLVPARSTVLMGTSATLLPVFSILHDLVAPRYKKQKNFKPCDRKYLNWLNDSRSTVRDDFCRYRLEASY